MADAIGLRFTGWASTTWKPTGTTAFCALVANVMVREPIGALADTDTVATTSVGDTTCVEVTVTPDPTITVVRPATKAVFGLPTSRTGTPAEPRRAETGWATLTSIT